MNSYFFVLGNTPALALSELQVVCQRQQIFATLTQLPDFPLVTVSEMPEAVLMKLAPLLGGTVKIAQILGNLPQLSAAELSSYLTVGSPTQLTFGISSFGYPEHDLTRLVGEVKRLLQPQIGHVRYVTGKTGTLSSVVITKQSVQELVVAFDQTKKNWLVGKTVFVQDVESWAKRDYGRPHADPKLGMLPPKVARMLVNLALTEPKDKVTVLDPFCGMGTILGEALLLGCHIIGSDISDKVVEQAKGNISWLRENFPISEKLTSQFLVENATHISSRLPPQSISAIVTEPYMGAPFEILGEKLTQKKRVVSEDLLKNLIRGLEKLYIGALRDWQKVLRPGGTICLILPQIRFNERTYFVKKVVDTCEKLGYTRCQGPCEYARPQAVVRRQIYVFRKLS